MSLTFGAFQIARQLEPTIGFAWATRVMGFIMIFNTGVIITLARPRHASRIKGPLVEWSSFREWPFTLFSIGIFLTLWGVYFAYYYVSISSPRSQNEKLTRLYARIDDHVREGGHPCLNSHIAHTSHNTERGWYSRSSDPSTTRGQIFRSIQHIDSIRSGCRHPPALLDSSFELQRICRICGDLRHTLQCRADAVSLNPVQSHNGFKQDGCSSGYGLHDCQRGMPYRASDRRGAG